MIYAGLTKIEILLELLLIKAKLELKLLGANLAYTQSAGNSAVVPTKRRGRQLEFSTKLFQTINIHLYGETNDY